MNNTLTKYGYIQQKKSFWMHDEESFNKIVKIAKRRKTRANIANYIGIKKLKNFIRTKFFKQKPRRSFQTELLRRGEFHKIKELSTISSNLIIKKLVNNYLGSKAKLTGCDIWYNYGENKEEPSFTKTQLFHCDRGPQKSYIKVFICLEEINSKNGPFTFYDAENTSKFIDKLSLIHKNKKLNQTNNLYHDNDVYHFFKEDSKKKFVGQVGDLLMCDVTRVLHQGARIEEGERLILMLVYSNRKDFAIIPKWSSLSR